MKAKGMISIRGTNAGGFLFYVYPSRLDLQLMKLKRFGKEEGYL